MLKQLYIRIISSLRSNILLLMNDSFFTALSKHLLSLNCWLVGFSIIFDILYLFSPQKVTPWNTKKLQEAIRNGADIHPGATHYRDKNNTYKLQAVPAKRHSVAKMLPASRGSICQPGRDPNCEFESKVVYRHLQDGDIVLVNRQVCLYSHSSIFLISNIWFSPSSPIETPF